jgi:two-component system cell cycle response regulator DivK
MAKILVVEDNPTNLKLTVSLLGTAGYTVISAADAEAGLAMARDEQPQLILMDMHLPGIDGLQATALLKQDDATRAIPVIALTALAMKGDEERIRAAGCDGYIAKPMRYRELLATVAAQLARAEIHADTPHQRLCQPGSTPLDVVVQSDQRGVAAKP